VCTKTYQRHQRKKRERLNRAIAKLGNNDDGVGHALSSLLLNTAAEEEDEWMVPNDYSDHFDETNEDECLSDLPYDASV